MTDSVGLRVSIPETMPHGSLSNSEIITHPVPAQDAVEDGDSPHEQQSADDSHNDVNAKGLVITNQQDGQFIELDETGDDHQAKGETPSSTGFRAMLAVGWAGIKSNM